MLPTNDVVTRHGPCLLTFNSVMNDPFPSLLKSNSDLNDDIDASDRVDNWGGIVG